MKVMQINSVCGFGSTGRIATDIHKILKEKGHESTIAYGRGIARNCDKAIRIGTKYDNYAHVALTRVFDKHGYGSKKATKTFIDQIENYDPDVIHIHNIHGYYINMKELFSYFKKTNRKIIWTLHDCWAFTGHCSYFDYSGCDRWKTGCYDCPQKKLYPKSYVYDNSATNYLLKKDVFTGIKELTIVTPSQWLADLVNQSYLKEYPIEVINNGIDLKVFSPKESEFRRKYNLEDKFIILGLASKWGKRKGFEYFIELSKRLNPQEVIVMVGVTEKQKELLPQNILGITRTNNTQELAEVYSISDVFLNPTLEDNFPTTNLESLACGTPVITFNTGGSPESLNNKCGYICKAKDTESILKAIHSISKKHMSTECIKQASRFDRSEMTNKYLMLYKEQLQVKGD